MAIYLGSLAQLCCEEGGALQTNITGVCGECSQCLGHTGFAPAHSECAFQIYTAQAPGCSAGELSKVGPGCVYFPGLSCSGSGSQVLHKGTDSVGPAFCALPRSEQVTRYLVSTVTPRWRVHLIASLIPAACFSGCAMGTPSRVCHVSLLGG